MTDQMILSAQSDRHPDFEHVAVYHDGHDDLADQLAPDIARAIAAGDAVLVCSPVEVWELIAERLGSSSSAVEYVPDDVRYDRPNVSMRILHDFVRDRTRSGARAWSIGAIPFDGEHAWEDLDAEVAWSVVMRHAQSAFYSHPWAWNEIGFGGPAYPRGYMRLSGRDPHEREEAFDMDPVREG